MPIVIILYSMNSDIWYQVFLSNTNNLYTYLTSEWGLVQLFWISVDLGVMAMKGKSTLVRVLELEPHRQMQLWIILTTYLSAEQSYPLAKNTVCIL